MHIQWAELHIHALAHAAHRQNAWKMYIVQRLSKWHRSRTFGQSSTWNRFHFQFLACLIWGRAPPSLRSLFSWNAIPLIWCYLCTDVLFQMEKKRNREAQKGKKFNFLLSSKFKSHFHRHTKLKTNNYYECVCVCLFLTRQRQYFSAFYYRMNK